MIAWYSRDRSWFNNSISSGRDTFLKPPYEYAAVSTAGSVFGAYLTFRIARKAGSAYLHSKFGHRKLDAILNFFHKWGTTALAVSTAVPIPMPTSMLFAAARCFGLRCREISDGSDHLPECTLHIHRDRRRSPVSYTHLTLPTNREV